MTAAVEGELARGTLIVLRSKRIEDVDLDYAWRRHPELAAFDATRPYNGGLSEYLSILTDELTYPSPYRRALAVEDFEGNHIGNVMYYNLDRDKRETEIGITIGVREYWGRGYGTDLMAVFTDYLLNELAVERVYLKTLDWNYRAQRCFEKAGYRRTGTSRRGDYNFILMEIRKADREAHSDRASDAPDAR